VQLLQLLQRGSRRLKMKSFMTVTPTTRSLRPHTLVA
jgi:hypothetical protein